MNRSDFLKSLLLIPAIPYAISKIELPKKAYAKFKPVKGWTAYEYGRQLKIKSVHHESGILSIELDETFEENTIITVEYK